MDLFHFDILSSYEFKIPAIIDWKSTYLSFNSDFSLEMFNELDGMTAYYLVYIMGWMTLFKIYDTTVSEGPVTISCYMQTARHIQ